MLYSIIYYRVNKHPERKLTDEHFNFLKSEQTLIAWAGFSLAERCKMFHRKYTDKSISTTRLASFYKRHHIRKKMIRRVKKSSASQINTRLEKQRYLVDQLKEMRRQKIKVIYLDETCFTKRTILSSTYCAKGQNIQVDEKDLYSFPSYVIAGVSQERGVEHVVNL